MAVSGTAVTAIAAGGICVYAGIKGISIPQAVQAIVQGRSPASLAQTNPITLPSTGGGSGGGGGNSGGGGGGGKTPSPDLPKGKATPPTVGTSPLPKLRLPQVAPPRPVYVPPQTILTQPPKKSSGAVWWKPWTWF